MNCLPGEALEAIDLGHPRVVEDSSRGHEDVRDILQAALALETPATVNPICARDLGAQPDVTAQPEVVRRGAEVALDLGTGRERSGPAAIRRERVGVEPCRHVAAQPRVAVLAPGAADLFGLLVDGEVIDPRGAELRSHAEPRHPRPDDDHPRRAGGRRQARPQAVAKLADRRVRFREQPCEQVEVVPQALEAVHLYIHPGGGHEPLGVAQQQVVSRTVKDERRQVRKVAVERRNCGPLRIVLSHVGGRPVREQVTAKQDLARRRRPRAGEVGAEVEPRADERDRGGSRLILIAQLHRQRQRQPTSCRVPGHSDARGRQPALEQSEVDAECILECSDREQSRSSSL